MKALRAYHMYLPNNPIYQRASDNLRIAFQPIWAVLDELVLTVAETDFVWEEQVVYHQLNKTESVAWGLFKDGMRSLTIRRGAELEELPRFLETINRARFLPTDAGDDLLTLLWEQEFEFIQYKFIEFFGEDGGGAGADGHLHHAAARTPRRPRAIAAPRRPQEAPPRPKGVVDLEEFDSTLYFLEEREINQVAAAVEDEYRRDVRMAALNVLFDLFELQGEDADPRRDPRRARERCFPTSSTPAISGRRPPCCARAAPARPARRRASAGAGDRLDGFIAKLSEPAIVSQLVQSLDEAPALAGEATVAEVLRELRATALEPILTWIPNLSAPAAPEGARGGRRPAGRGPPVGGAAHPPLARVGGARGRWSALCGRLQLTPDGARPRRDRRRTRTRRSAWPRCRRSRSSARPPRWRSSRRRWRTRTGRCAWRRSASSGARGYKGAQRRIESMVLGKSVEEMDLTEKMAFFEAYGAIAGAGGAQAAERAAAAARACSG